MKQIKLIIENIQADNSKKWKESVLKDNMNSNELKAILNFVYNPYILSGLSTKKINKKVPLTPTKHFNNLLELLDYLKENSTGTDQVIANVQNYLKDDIYSELSKKIITKSLKLGCDAKTINKAFGYDFIPQFNVMLANKWIDYKDKIADEILNGFIITEKLDGTRNVAIVERTGEINMFTRQGQKNEGFIDIEKELSCLPKGYAYDGELIAVNETNLDSADLFRKTMTATRKDGIKQNVVFHIFDMIPVEEFRNGISYASCRYRKGLLNSAVSEYPDLKWIKSVPVLYQGTDKLQVQYWLNKLTSEGKEGCMVNLSDAPYVCKRSKSLLKCKKMQSVDLKIIGFENGEGRLSGTLGRINVNYKGNLIGVGSGFTDDDRDKIWINQNKYYGKIVEVAYFEESTNSKTGEISLRFPIFKCIRDDKTEESYF